MPSAPVRHASLTVDGVETFYRECGPPDAPVLLLPHGYPASSFVYRELMAALGDRWRTVSPDLPGFGYSATPSASEFGYTFDAYVACQGDGTRVWPVARDHLFGSVGMICAR